PPTPPRPPTGPSPWSSSPRACRRGSPRSTSPTPGPPTGTARRASTATTCCASRSTAGAKTSSRSITRSFPRNTPSWSSGPRPALALLRAIAPARDVFKLPPPLDSALLADLQDSHPLPDFHVPLRGGAAPNERRQFERLMAYYEDPAKGTLSLGQVREDLRCD